MTKFLLDSGDPQEYIEIARLAKAKGLELWGSTTNPSLIAKKLAGRKVSAEDAFGKLQKQIITDILAIVPGAVSAEVYATHETTASDMIEQGRIIATWDPRVVVKLPTTIESFTARTELRKLGIGINNTLVFSQEQTFAITLHEKIMTSLFGKPTTPWPCFISPFVGRLDDIGINGMSMVKHAIDMLQLFFPKDLVWMLEASIRNPMHMKQGLDLQVDLITAPGKIYSQWFNLSEEEKLNIPMISSLTQIAAWIPSQELLDITTIDAFMDAITTKKLDIHHDLTDKGIDRFVADWQQIII